jgi:hypothetical protein
LTVISNVGRDFEGGKKTGEGGRGRDVEGGELRLEF